MIDCLLVLMLLRIGPDFNVSNEQFICWPVYLYTHKNLE